MFLLITQLIITLLIIIYIPYPILQVILLISVWTLTFRKVTLQEILIFLISCLFYTIADYIVISKNIFTFTNTNIWNMPYYEPLMWGYYFVHAKRLIGDYPVKNLTHGIIFTLMFISSLTFLKNEKAILITAALLLLVALCFFFKTKYDFLYAGYFLFIGCIIEYIGTKTNIWSYHIDNHYAWWIITWTGSGIVLYRTILPLTSRLVADNRKLGKLF